MNSLIKAIGKETLIVFGGVVCAAFLMSRFPRLKAFVAGQSITVKDQTGNTLF